MRPSVVQPPQPSALAHRTSNAAEATSVQPIVQPQAQPIQPKPVTTDKATDDELDSMAEFKKRIESAKKPATEMPSTFADRKQWYRKKSGKQSSSILDDEFDFGESDFGSATKKPSIPPIQPVAGGPPSLKRQPTFGRRATLVGQDSLDMTAAQLPAGRRSGKAEKTPGSAKQHYLQHARYYPGAPAAMPARPLIEGKVVDIGSGTKVVELTSSGMKNSSGGVKLVGVGANYVPSVAAVRKRDSIMGSGVAKDWSVPPAAIGATKKQSTVGAPATFQLPSTNKMGQGLHGRTDWSNKYGGGR